MFWLLFAIDGHAKSRPYRWEEIRVQHRLETGRRCSLPGSGRGMLDAVLSAVPRAIEETRERLPQGFPEAVHAPIFAGLQRATKGARAALASASRRTPQ